MAGFSTLKNTEDKGRTCIAYSLGTLGHSAWYVSFPSDLSARGRPAFAQPCCDYLARTYCEPFLNTFQFVLTLSPQSSCCPQYSVLNFHIHEAMTLLL